MLGKLSREATGWFRTLRDGRTRVREPWPARYVQPASFAPRAPGLPRQSLPCVLVSRAQSSRAVWAEVILQVRELHGDRQRIFAVFYVLDIFGVRLGSLVARQQCHRSNDPNRYTSREQIVRGVRAIFDYIVQPRDRLGVVTFHQVDNPLDVLDIGVPGALLGLAGVGLARNILGKQEDRAGLRYCSDRQYRFMGPRPSPFLRAPRLVVAQIVGPELLFAKRARP